MVRHSKSNASYVPYQYVPVLINSINPAVMKYYRIAIIVIAFNSAVGRNCNCNYGTGAIVVIWLIFLIAHSSTVSRYRSKLVMLLRSCVVLCCVDYGSSKNVLSWGTAEKSNSSLILLVVLSVSALVVVVVVVAVVAVVVVLEVSTTMLATASGSRGTTESTDGDETGLVATSWSLPLTLPLSLVALLLRITPLATNVAVVSLSAAGSATPENTGPLLVVSL